MTLKYKEITINTDTKEVLVNNTLTDIDKREYYLLVFFMFNKNKIFTREELIQEVWNKDITIKAVDTCISRLRRKLGEASKYVITRKGFGFGFIDSE